MNDPGGSLTHLFPTPDALADADASLPASRGHTLTTLVEALSHGTLPLGPGCDRAEALAVLAAMPGIGPWTARIIAMRALGDPDAFPASDLGVRRGAAVPGNSLDTGGPLPAGGAVATMAGLCRPVPMGGHRSPRQPMAASRGESHSKFPSTTRSHMTPSDHHLRRQPGGSTHPDRRRRDTSLA